MSVPLHNIDESEAARGIEGKFGTPMAGGYLVGEKPMKFLEVAEIDTDFPAFVAEVQSISDRLKLAQYLETPRTSEPFDSKLFDGDNEINPKEIEEISRMDIRQCTRDLLLAERANGWSFENSQVETSISC